MFLNEHSEPDLARRAENKWRRQNSFTTLQVLHQGSVILEYLLFDVHEGVKFDGVPQASWAAHVLEKYRGRISDDIRTFAREQMVQEWLDSDSLMIMELEEYNRLRGLKQVKVKPTRKRRDYNRHLCESNILPGSVGITRRFTRQMGRNP